MVKEDTTEGVNRTVDNTIMIVGMLVVVAIIMAMFVALAFRMPLKHTRWFFVASFTMLAGLMFREHWAAGTFVAIIGGGGVAALTGIMRQVEQDKRAREAKTEV